MEDSNSFKKLKIGYAPYSKNLNGPGDRRRFCFFAKEYGLAFETLKNKKNYDLVILTSTSDLSKINYLKKKNTKIIIDLVDSYLVQTKFHEDYLRYMGRSFTNKKLVNIIFPTRFTDHLKRSISKSDAVICSTAEQRKEIKKYNSNVHIILDNMDDDVINIEKSYIKREKEINILWEGLASNIYQIKELKNALNNIGDFTTVNLHIISDLSSYKFFSSFYKINSEDIINNISLKINTYLYQWNPTALASIASICDFGIIPVDQKSLFTQGKPENKLLLLWKLGLPVLVSNTKAYSRTIKSAALSESMLCRSQKDWEKNILNFINLEPKQKEIIANKAKAFANKHSNKEVLLKLWLELFKSVS